MKQFAVIGMGRFGSSVAQSLFEQGYDVLAIDIDADLIDEISTSVTHAVQADATDETTLKALGLRNFDVAVVTIGKDIQASILICLLCKEQGVHQVIAKAQNKLHARVLRKIGVDKIVLPERDMGIRLAKSLVSSNVLEFIELSNDYSLVEVATDPAWEGKSLRELNMRVNYGVNVMAIKHDGSINISPQGEDILRQGDTMVVIGSNQDIAQLERQTKQR